MLSIIVVAPSENNVDEFVLLMIQIVDKVERIYRIYPKLECG
jgi:hypothetical protein